MLDPKTVFADVSDPESPAMMIEFISPEARRAFQRRLLMYRARLVRSLKTPTDPSPLTGLEEITTWTVSPTVLWVGRMENASGDVVKVERG